MSSMSIPRLPGLGSLCSQSWQNVEALAVTAITYCRGNRKKCRGGVARNGGRAIAYEQNPKPRPRSGTTLVVLVGAGLKPAATSFAAARCLPSGVCGTLIICDWPGDGGRGACAPASITDRERAARAIIGGAGKPRRRDHDRIG